MEEKKISIIRITSVYGLILAGITIIFSLIIFLLDTNPESLLNYFSYVFLVAGIIIAQINYKNKYLGGLIPYGKAVNVGFLTSVWCAIIMAVFTYIQYIYIDPGAIEEIRNYQEERMIRRGMSDLEIDEMMKMMEPFQSPLWYAIAALFGNILLGLVISLITAIFIKKEDQSVMPQA